MSVPEIIQKVRSGVCKIEFYIDDEIVNSGSGFIYNNKLVTNSHVFHPEGYIFREDTNLVIIFGDGRSLQLQIKDLELVIGSSEEYSDYAIYDFDYLSKPNNNLFNFELDSYDSVREGDEVILLGFPFESKYLTTHFGRISALYTDKEIKKIQIDASVNQGNSGGPLIHLATQKVIGIVTRKNSGLANDFDALLRAISANISLLENLQRNGSVRMNGIDLWASFKSTQSQMLVISKNIKRSANTGIGYAFSCEKLMQEDI